MLATQLNRVLVPMGIRLVPATVTPSAWDASFRRWIRQAQASGRDPNDVADQEWDGEQLKAALERLVFPHLSPQATVLELGPGSGRVTRHLIARCHNMILLDSSRFVCRFLSGYLKGKGNFRCHHIHGPQMPMVAAASVDAGVAIGVFEHLDVEDTLWFLEEFFRVLKPGGIVVFDFDNGTSAGGLSWLRQTRGAPGERSVFRFYHPEQMRALAQSAGFEVAALESDGSRDALIQLRKPRGSRSTSG